MCVTGKVTRHITAEVTTHDTGEVNMHVTRKVAVDSTGASQAVCPMTTMSINEEC